MLLWAVFLVFGIGIVLLVVVLLLALVDNRVNYGRWRPKKDSPADTPPSLEDTGSD